MLDRLTRLLLVVVLFHCTTDGREHTVLTSRPARRNLSRRDKPYCYRSNVRYSLLTEYCESAHQMTSGRCTSYATERSVSTLFQRLLKLAVSARRQHKVTQYCTEPKDPFCVTTKCYRRRTTCSVRQDKACNLVTRTHFRKFIRR